MARVDFDQIVLSVATDPTDRLMLNLVRSWQKAPAVQVRYMTGAGGRLRQFTRAGTSESWAFTFGSVTPAQKAWLRAHMGALLCVRDDRGGKLFGSYSTVPWTERTYSKDADQVTLTVTELTWSEAV